jgi:hypothetical protein
MEIVTDKTVKTLNIQLKTYNLKLIT